MRYQGHKNDLFSSLWAIFNEIAKSKQSDDYCLSLTQDSQSESGESVKFIEKSDLSGGHGKK